jgi:hypothetical protein
MTLSEAAMARIIALFKPPRFEDEEKTRQAFLLHVILWAFIVVPILLFVYTLFFSIMGENLLDLCSRQNCC